MSDTPAMPPEPTVVDLVDQVEELLSTGRRVPFTAGVVVNEDDVMELIDRVRLSLPDELMQARHLLEDRERTVADAQHEAERILAHADAESERLTREAEARVAVMVSEHAIGDQARALTETTVAEAEERAATIRSEADAYAREVMLQLEEQLTRAATTVRRGIDSLPSGGTPPRRRRRERGSERPAE